MWLVIAAALACLLSASTGSAQVTLNWTKNLSIDVDAFRSTDILASPGGDMYLAGEIARASGGVVSHAVVKYDVHGKLLWSRSIALNDYCTMVLRPKIALDSAGNLVLIHQVYDAASDSCPGNLTKFSGDGTQVWSIKPAIDASDFSVNAAGAIGVVGMPGDHDFAFQKYSSEGVLLWSATYGADFSTYPFQVLVAADGSVYLLSNGPLTSNDDIVLIKYSSGGTLQWTRVYNSNDDWPGEMAFDSSGNICVVGFSDSDGEGGPDGHDLVTMKYNPAGDLLWARRYSSGISGYGTGDMWYDPAPAAITFDASGNVIVAARNAGGTSTRFDFATVKYDADGNELWSRRFNGPGCDDEAGDLVAGPAGDIYVVGNSEDTCPGSTDWTASLELVQYDSSGTLLGHDRRGTPSGEDWRFAMPKIAIHPQGSAFVIMGNRLSKYACIALTPGSAAPAFSASTGSVSVTPGNRCPNWAATSDSPWLAVTGGASGSGNGTVDYSVTQNTSGAERTGIISIGDATFVVKQASDVCELVTPSNLLAARHEYGVRVTWTSVPGTLYEIQRKSRLAPLGGWETLSTTATSPWTEQYTFYSYAYLYRARAVSSCTASPFSNVDLVAGPRAQAGFVDDPVVAGSTPVMAEHLQELQEAINAVRELAWMSAATYTDNASMVPGGTIRAKHISEMRAALNVALTALGLPNPTYSDPDLTPGITPIRAAHIQELRNALR